MRKDADNLAFELGKLREEKAKDQDEINRLRDGVAFKERECQDNDARIKAVDYDLFKAQERANELAKLADAKEFELRRTCFNPRQKYTRLQRPGLEISSLTKKYGQDVWGLQ